MLEVSDSQVSPTQNTCATSAQKRATTWDYSCSKGDKTPQSTTRCITQCITPCITGCTSQWGTHCTTPANHAHGSPQRSRESWERAVLQVLIGLDMADRIYQREYRITKSTELAHDSELRFQRSFRHLPASTPLHKVEEKVAASLQLLDGLPALAEEAARRWRAAGLETRCVPEQKALLLPCPASRGSTRWRGEVAWRVNALADPNFRSHPRMARVSRRHTAIILATIAAAAERSSGRWVAVSARTVAYRVARRIAKTGGRIPSESTLVSSVRACWAALRATGWAVERARGRHLRRDERLVAYHRHGIVQTRAASVHDLSMPQAVHDAIVDSLRRQQKRARPAWARQYGQHSSASGDLLHTHQLCCTRSRSFSRSVGNSSARVRVRGKKPRPSLSAQKLVAQVIYAMPWITRGGRIHLWSLARAVEDSGILNRGWSPRQVMDRWDALLSSRWWAIEASAISHPVPWLQACLETLKNSYPKPGVVQ